MCWFSFCKIAVLPSEKEFGSGWFQVRSGPCLPAVLMSAGELLKPILVLVASVFWLV